MRNVHIQNNFQAQYSEVAKSYFVDGRLIQERLEFQIVDMDDDCVHVWVKDLALNEYYNWIMNTQRFLERVGELRPTDNSFNEQLRLFV